MKNHKGVVATLLTLGLVLVGTLITLGTSLFVNNKKTNLASNSRAACISQPQPCTTVKSTYKIGVYYSSNGKYYKSINCGTELVEGVGTYCKNMNPSTSSPTIPATATGCINNIPSLYECKDAFNNKPVTYSSVTKKCCLAGSANPPPTAPTPTLSPKGCGSGGGYPCDPAQGYDPTSCPKPNLEFACCVKDKSSCGGEPRYRWYGCTGQPCGNTKINNSYGQLFGCPAGINASNTSPESGICESQLTPTKAPPPASPSPGYEGGSCKGLYKEDGMWKGKCVGGLTCNYKTGKCIKYTPPTVIPAGNITTPAATPILSPTMKVEGTCKASGTSISFGNCSYLEASGTQDCSNSTPLPGTSVGCTIFRVCGGTDCRYDCYENDKQKSCVGAGDPQTGYDYIRIVNSSTKDIVIGKIIIEKMQGGGNPVSDQGGDTLKPGETKTIDLNQLGGTYACSALSINSIRVILLNPDGSQLATAKDGCGGGVKILINLK